MFKRASKSGLKLDLSVRKKKTLSSNKGLLVMLGVAFVSLGVIGAFNAETFATRLNNNVTTHKAFTSIFDVTSGFTNCSGTQYLGADGACHDYISRLWMNNGGDVYVDSGNVGIGKTIPTARLHTKGSLSIALTGTVAVTAASATVTGTGTVFTTELVVGDSIKIGTEKFTISAIASATTLTLDTNHLAGAIGVKAYKDSDLFKLDNGDGVNKVVVDKSGNLTANAFIGDGSGLTNLPTVGNSHVQNTDYKIEKGVSGILIASPPYTNAGGTSKFKSLSFQAPSNALITSIKVKFITDVSNNYSDLVVDIFDHEFVLGELFGSRNNVLLAGQVYRESGLTVTPTDTYKTYTLTTPFAVTAGQKYSIVIYSGTGNSSTKGDLHMAYAGGASTAVTWHVATLGVDYKAVQVENPIEFEIFSNVLTQVAATDVGAVEFTANLFTFTGGNISASGSVTATAFIGDGSGLTGLPAGLTSSGVTGAIQFSDGSGTLSAAAADLFWDNTNKRLGIGTDAPSGTLKLDVEGLVGAAGYCDANGANCKTIVELVGGSGVPYSGAIGDLNLGLHNIILAGLVDGIDVSDLSVSLGTNTTNISTNALVLSSKANKIIPSNDTALLATTTLSVIEGIMRVVGSGGAVILTSVPSIADGTDGQVVIIQGTSDTNLVTFQDKSSLATSGLELSGGYSFTLGKGDTLQLMYDLGDDTWYELTRSDN